MGKYADMILGPPATKKDGNTPQETPKRQSYSDFVYGLKPEKKYIDQPDRTPTGEISAVTGQPISKMTGNPNYKPADMMTLMKAGFVDNNDAKIKLFADARGIDPSRYEVKDGKIWFHADDGNMYPETPREFDSIIKKMLAELPSEGLADFGAGVGAMAGPLGAMAGAGTGELIRKQIGEQFFGDQQGIGEYAKDIGIQVALGGLDASFASSLMNRLNARKIKNATGGRLTGDLVSEVGNISDAQRMAGRTMKAKGDDIGVDLLPHQAMDDPTLTGYYSMLRDNPKTARQVRAADDMLDKQVSTAADDLVLDISPNETDPYEVGARLSNAADDILGRMKKDRSDIAKPYYDAAYGSGVQVDAEPVLNEIISLKATTKQGMKAHNALTRIERMLTKKGHNGKPTPETDIQIIDNVKQEIDGILAGRNSNSITNKMKRKLMMVKEQLTTQTDAVSPDYKKARELFAKASPEINKTENGIVGQLAGMKSDEIKEKAVSKIFASPRSIRVAKRKIEAADPDLWKDAVAEYMRGSFEKVSKVSQGSGGKVLNRPGKYASKMWDAPDMKKLKNATQGMSAGDGTPLFERISDFFEVMQKASIGQGKESATQPRQKMERELQGAVGKISSGIENLKSFAIQNFFSGAKERAFDRNARRLLDLMQTQEGVELIAKAKGYGPITEKGVKAATTLLMMATQTNAPKVVDAVTALPDQDE